MASALRGVFASLVVFNAINLIICKSELAPVLLWQTSSLGSDLPLVSALDRLSLNEFTDDMIDKLNSRGPILFFLQDDLSIEDFTLWGNIYGSRNQKNSFPNLEKLLNSSPSAFFPAVESPADSVTILADGRKVVEVTGDQLSGLSSKDLDNTVLVYNLPNTETSKNRQQALSRNDQIISEAVDAVSSKSPSYTAFYTARHSSWFSVNEDNLRPLRHTLATTDSGSSTNGTFFGANCSAIYFDTVAFLWQEKKTGSNSFDTQTYDLTGGGFSFSHSCEEQNSSVVWFKLTYNNESNPNITFMEIYMQFGLVIVNDWNITDMTITYTLKDGAQEHQKLDLDTNLWAPMRFSYHCGNQTFQNDTYDFWSSSKKAAVTFTNLQIQVFEFDTKDQFGDPFDCVGFFTIGIWMSIFISAILVIILGFGIHMTMSIETMDRFDDPKGKTITINATD